MRGMLAKYAAAHQSNAVQERADRLGAFREADM